MNFFDRIKAFISPSSKEQIIGYSISELQAIFTAPLLYDKSMGDQPKVLSLDRVGVSACYASFLIDQCDVPVFRNLIELKFRSIERRVFNGIFVERYEGVSKAECLIFCVSTREFNSATIQVIANDLVFFDSVRRAEFDVPPPWVAFDQYPPSWWGENMQGAQGYYNDNYFFPYFIRLSEAQRHIYYRRYNAAGEWISSLELMLSE